MALMVLLPPASLPVAAAGESRTLFFHHTHTGKTASFTFKVNGQYDQNVLRQMNLFLADWRTHEPTKMDPALFDLLWNIYREVGATQPINIVSSYRTPATNKMLRSKSKAVAENSQHMRGKAMDIFIPGVPLAKLRATAMRHNVGGVGYYPTSGSPFVHVDTGTVRAWPRMTRAQLEKVFPDGKTLHLPVDGKPLSAAGRRYAEAEWNKCHMVPCNGAPSFAPDIPTGTPDVMVASNSAPVPATPSPGILGAIFGNGSDSPSAAAEPTQRVVSTVAVVAPIPVVRHAAQPQVTQVATADGFAPIPAMKSPSLRVATGPSMGESNGETALVALANLGGAPQPRVLLTPRGGEQPDAAPSMVTAYVPALPQDPGAQRALQMIIERETTASLPQMKSHPQPAPAANVQVASLGQPPASSGGLDVIANLFQDTWNAVTGMGKPPLQAALDARVTAAPDSSLKVMDVDLVAPDVDHVAETMVQPVAMSDMFFGEMYEPEGYLEKSTQLGPLSTRIGFDPDPTIDAYNSFVVGTPQLVASR